MLIYPTDSESTVQVRGYAVTVTVRKRVSSFYPEQEASFVR